MSTVRPPRRSAAQDQAFTDIRIPPSDVDAEMAVIGSIIQSVDALKAAAEICTEDDFYRQSTQKLYRAVMELHRRGEPVDTLTLANELKTAGDLEIVGGVSAITEAIMAVPAPGNVVHYADIVREKAARRSAIAEGSRLVQDAYDNQVKAEELIERAKSANNRLSNNLRGLKDFDDSPGSAANEAMTSIETSWTGKKKRFVKTGFEMFDREHMGLERSNLIVLSGRKEAGKSAWTTNVVLRMAYNCIPTGYCVLDTDRKTVPIRIVCSIVGVRWRDVFSSDELVMTKEKRERVIGAFEMFKEMPIYPVGQGELHRDFRGFCDWARWSVEKHGVQCIFIDSGSKFKLHRDRSQTNEEVMTEMINDLIALAQELDIPIVCIVEMSRGDGDPASRLKGTATWEFAPRVHFHLERDADDKDVAVLKCLKNSNMGHGKDLRYRVFGAHFKLTEIDPEKAATKATEETEGQTDGSWRGK